MEDISQPMRQRLEKLSSLKEMGVDPYPHHFDRSHQAGQIHHNFDNLENQVVSVAGRIMSDRSKGKVAFLDLQDMSGRIQLFLKFDNIGPDSPALYKLLDIGDFIGASGEVFKTRTGEISIRVKKFVMLSKSIRPLPVVKEKIEDGQRITYDEVSDKEMRYRQRYVDLVINPDVREVFVKRSKIMTAMREFLNNQEFLEVETPILQPIYGGASARPFVTHHNTLNMKLYLRIANELYLKRLIVGGFDGVYEFAKDFRNEGMSRFHNPEFTQMEVYAAYRDYHWMMELVEQMVNHIAQAVLGTTTVTFGEHQIDLGPPWHRLPLLEGIKEYTGKDLSGMDEPQMRKVAEELKMSIDPGWNGGKILDEIFGEFVEPHLIQPTFITDHPVEISPLAKRHRSKPGLVERFEPVIAGKEIGNAFTELNDPLDQRERFEAQMGLKSRGDEEAQMMDEDYLRAMEYGMPPTAGLGIGIDRLTMILTGQPSIRDVIFFPQLRPEQNSGEERQNSENT